MLDKEDDDERRHLLKVDQSTSKTFSHQRLQVDQSLNFFERRRRLKLLKKYYEEQDRLVQLYEQDAEFLSKLDNDEVLKQAKMDKEQQMIWDRRYAILVFVSNVFFLTGNLTASILSGSYSIISAFIDSLMDIMSSVTVYLTIRAVKNTDPFKYPRGRNRLELVSVICCSIFMGVSNIMIIVQSVGAILSHDVGPDMNVITISIILVSVTAKFIIMIGCYRHNSTSTKILALDQRNDIITSFVALTGAYVGSNYWPYADPIGAILVCSFIAGSWFCNAFSQVPFIAGCQAEQKEISRILAITINDDPRIKCLDHIMVYYIGEGALVELHIVLDEHLPLRITHDICETLQNKIDALSFVERTFIHVDYCCDGCLDGK